jgi:hypothetical protein
VYNDPTNATDPTGQEPNKITNPGKLGNIGGGKALDGGMVEFRSEVSYTGDRASDDGISITYTGKNWNRIEFVQFLYVDVRYRRTTEGEWVYLAAPIARIAAGMLGNVNVPFSDNNRRTIVVDVPSWALTPGYLKTGGTHSQQGNSITLLDSPNAIDEYAKRLGPPMTNQFRAAEMEVTGHFTTYVVLKDLNSAGAVSDLGSAIYKVVWTRTVFETFPQLTPREGLGLGIGLAIHTSTDDAACGGSGPTRIVPELPILQNRFPQPLQRVIR